MTFDGKTNSSHLPKLENALFALASMIQQGHLLYSKKVSITGEKKMYVLSLKTKTVGNG